MTTFGSTLSSEEHAPRALVDNASVLDSVRRFRDAGYDHLSFHQIGPDQRGVLDFWSTRLRPALAELAA